MPHKLATIPISEALHILPQRLGNATVLSAYLDTSPGRTDGPAWTFALRDGCKAIRGSLGDSAGEGFETAVRLAEEYVNDELVTGQPGLALFATEDLGGYAVPLPYSPVEGVVWAQGSRIEPLVATLDEFERFAVVLFDKERARLFTVFLGEIETKQEFEDYVPREQATGGWFGLAQTRYARHREDRVRRHANHAIEALLSLRRDHPFDRLLIGGPDEAAALLQRELPASLRARVAGRLDLELFASDAEVLGAALGAAEQIERQREIEMVAQLLDAGGRAVVGVDATLADLAAARIHEVVLADTFQATAAQCLSCHRLVLSGPLCPACGAPTEPVADLREQIVRRAIEQGAGVEIVRGQAAASLAQQGGIAAWTRY